VLDVKSLSLNYNNIIIVKILDIIKVVRYNNNNKVVKRIFMDNIVGTIAENEDFFPRDKFINRFYKGLKKQNYILSAPRRSGKSSILTNMYDNQKDLFHIIHFDVEGATNEIEFFEMIIESLEKEKLLKSDYSQKTLAFLSKVETKHINIIETEFNINTFIDNLLKNLIQPNDKLIVLAIDEFSTFLAKIGKENDERAKDFLDLNRKFRLDKQVSKIFRFVYTGSIGLVNIVEKLNYSKSINDLDTMILKALNEEEAILFLTKLFESYNLQYEEAHIKYSLAKINWYMPFFIQLLFKHIEEYMDENDLTNCSNMIIDIAYENIFALTNKKHFSHWKERLKDAYEKNEIKFLIEVLNYISNNEQCDILDVENIRTLYKLKHDTKYYINALEYDGYILNVDDKYRFISPILQKWWAKYV